MKKLSFRAAISVLVFLCILTLPLWRSLLIYYEYRIGNTVTTTTECTSISISRTDELRRFTSFYTTYCLHLYDGTTVSIYKKTAERIFPSEDVMKQQLVSGSSITFTYIEKPTLSDGSYPLVAMTSRGVPIMAQTVGISPFSERVKTVLIVDSIGLVFAMLLFVLPILVPHLHKTLRRAKNERRKKCLKKKADH